jgi:hypothetical protein
VQQKWANILQKRTALNRIVKKGFVYYYLRSPNYDGISSRPTNKGPATIADVAELGNAQDVDYIMNFMWAALVFNADTPKIKRELVKLIFVGAFAEGLAALAEKSHNPEEEISKQRFEAFRSAVRQSKLGGLRATGLADEAWANEELFSTEIALKFDRKGRLLIPEFIRLMLGPNAVATISPRRRSLLIKGPRMRKN